MRIARSVLIWGQAKKLAISGSLLLGALGGATLAVYKGYKSKSETIRAGISGSLGALVVEVICHPIDTLNMATKAECSRDSTKYAVKFVRERGVRSLYRGINLVLLGYPSFLFGYYWIYQGFKRMLRDRHYINSEALVSGVSALVAEVIFVTLVYPFELFKTRMQVPCIPGQAQNYGLTYLRDLIQTKGIVGLKECYVGYVPHITTYGIFVGMQFGIYEGIIHFYRKIKKNHSDVPPLTVILLASIISGALASIPSNPFEALTVLSQTKGKLRLRELLRNRSIWYHGLGPRVLYNAALTFLLFFALEHSFALFNVKFSE